MTSHRANDRLSLSSATRAVLEHVRALLRTYVLAQLVLLLIGWGLALFWIGGMVDYLPVTVGANETPRWLRIGLLVVFGLGAFWLVFLWAFPRIFVRPSDQSLALLLERHHPQLNNELLTAVDYANPHSDFAFDVSDPEAHQEMLASVHQSLEGKLASIDAGRLFNWQPVWAAGVGTAFAAVVTIVAAVGMPDWMSHWSQRLFRLSDAPWPRRAALRADGLQVQIPSFSGQYASQRVLLPFTDGVVRVAAGATPMLQVSAEAERKQIPEVCTLFYASTEGGRGRANMRRVGRPQSGWQRFTLDGPPLDGIDADMQLDVIGLDARLRDLHIQVVEPCVVAELSLECRYPKYLLDSLSRPATEMLPYRSGVRVPEGTEVTLIGNASASLSQVEYTLRLVDGQPDSESQEPEFEIRKAVIEGDTFSVPLGVLRESRVVEVRVQDIYGLTSDRIPQYVIGVQEDVPPEVASTFLGIGNSITDKAILQLQVKAEDDHGVASVQVEMARGENSTSSFPLDASTGEIAASLDLLRMAEQGIFNVEVGDTLGMSVVATDYFDLDEAPHIGRGPAQQLAVVTEDELLVLLDRQELEMRQRVEQVLSELQQLRDVLTRMAANDSQTDLQDTKRADSLVATPSQVNTLTPQSDDESEVARRRRQRVFRAQQGVLQGDKSAQELQGVAGRIDNLRLQLQNNRVDSYDRQQRLQLKVHDPLVTMLNGSYLELDRALETLLRSVQADANGQNEAVAAIAKLDLVLSELTTIRDSMLDIESFNEIIDLVRGLLEDQDRLLNDTEKAQREKLLQLLQ